MSVTTIVIFVLIGVIIWLVIDLAMTQKKLAEYIDGARADIRILINRVEDLERPGLEEQIEAITTKTNNMYRWLNRVSNRVNLPDEEGDEQ
jgi:predicted PurR-regulated permease PerM